MFTISIAELTELFEPDNVRQGTSLKKVEKWGKIEGFENLLQTSFKKGLTDSPEAQSKRVQAYGRNDPVVKKSKTLLEMIIETFEDTMLRVLCAAAIVSLILGIATQGLEKGWMEGASILMAVVIIVTVTSGNNWIKEQQFKKLNTLASRKNVDVLRNGQIDNISVYDLLVGDVQLVQTGQIVSVDGILIEGHNLVADQSSMTGEPLGIRKSVPTTYQADDKSNPFIISGSKIMEGNGRMIVLATGQNSQFGILKKKIQGSNDETPLQEKLTVLADKIGLVGSFAAGLTFICMLGHIIYDAYATGNFVDSLFNVDTLNQLVEAFIVAVSIIVVAVPQGLPLAVTIALAYSVGKMKDQNNLVRYLQACETMGGADNICSDKTGTLTKNLMTVTKVFIQEKTVSTINKDFVNKDIGWLLGTSICQNTNANPVITEVNGDRKIDQIGNKTDCALIELAYILGYDYRKVRNGESVIKIFPFASETKTMTTVSRENGKVYVFSKGAPDFVVKNCTQYLNAEGKPTPITPQFKATLQGKLKEFAHQTLRTLLLAYREGKDESENSTIEDVAKDLIIIGMVGIKDPLREAVPHAVQLCKEAGVTVRMITGDNPETAVAIAKEAGILPEDWKASKDDCTVMTGQDFRTFVGGLVKADKQANEKVGNLQNFKKVATQLRVLARSSPTDKYIMATGLKQLHHVVAMTGDGTNDAPALKKADIGFAMGIAGTEVAKEASGIILLDDNFKSIVTAMKWGRNIFDSIRKFLQFQLTVNFCALIMAFVGAAVLKESPLNPIQMLWVNLIMDTLASLALATQPPSDQLLKRKPYSRFENLITPDMWKNIISQGLLQIFILGTILFKGPQIFGIQSSIGVEEWNSETGKHYSIFFNTFVLLQVFNEINSRKLKSQEINIFKNFFNNPLFFIILILTIAIQIACIQFGGESLRTVPLTLHEHLICLGLGSLPLFFGVIFKLLIPSSIFNSLSKDSVPEENAKQE